MTLRVECIVGMAGEMEPHELWFGHRHVPIRDVVDRWWGPHHRWWKVDTAEGMYVLRRDERTEAWELAAVVGQ